MTSQPSTAHTLPSGEELLGALVQFFRDHFAPHDACDEVGELSLFQLQKLVTLGQLTSQLVHDFGNLTTILIGFSEMLLSAIDPNLPERTYAAELYRASQKASDLTAELLCYSRPAGSVPTPLDFSATARSLKPFLARLLGPPITLTVTAPPSAPLVLAELRQVEQALVNLILNARDALPTGGHVELAVEVVRLRVPLDAAFGNVRAGDYVRVRVTDDGSGMDAATQAQLFRPFFTTKPRGAGLGLTIVAQIVHRSGAAVAVQSQPNRGTTVALYFPQMTG